MAHKQSSNRFFVFPAFERACVALSASLMISSSSAFADVPSAAPSNNSLNSAKSAAPVSDKDLDPTPPHVVPPSGAPKLDDMPTAAKPNENVAGTAVEINHLSNQILITLIEMERLNAHYRLETSFPVHGRLWRQTIYAEANNGISEIGLIEQTNLRWGVTAEPHTTYSIKKVPISGGRTYDELVKTTDPSRRKITVQRNEQAQIFRLVGGSIAIAGDIIELTINQLKNQRLRREGFSAPMYRKRVHAVRERLDSLITTREKAVEAYRSQSSAVDIAVLDAETRVLENMRDLSLMQYTRYHEAARKLRITENAAYLLDLAKNGTGITANIISLQASHLNRTRYNGASGVMNTVSGAFIMLTPIFGRVSGDFAGLMARKASSTDYTRMHLKSLDIFSADRERLREALRADLVGEISESTAKRLPLYELNQSQLDNYQTSLVARSKEARASLMENLVFGTIVGGSKVAFGVTGTIGGWREFGTPYQNNRLSAAGTTAYMAGNSFAMFENLRVRLAGDAKTRRQRRLGIEPRQVIHRNLEIFEEVEKSLKDADSSAHS